ncbi:trk system potassium uptake protein TrkA [Paucidesulfovibrio gracilis DSM 16080]|uniref:Trk system potassium uptake protein TrkA n=1 Tax=Paucidesulfovibrio gracilis DSM 16080 TaxID=1121449 RepID=A0A1T4X4U9_9BACT|nr:TrkA family potassium uptake protein [Paucidesulfovibrio gracilis]SKA84477.1 trk system potassium uptake protein TrkA [Paucidesulfovibrio gracilis DSM 16080]
MGKRIEVGIIGLGKFGYSLGEALAELGHDVVGVDISEAHVRHAQEVLTQVFQADGTDPKALEQLGFKDLDYVVVSIGRSMEASILVALNLQELGVNNIWVKAVSPEHEKVLKRLGVDFVVFPEQFVARQLAHRLAVPGLLDYLALGKGVLVREVEVEHWGGRTLRDLRLPTDYRVQVVAWKHKEDRQFSFVPGPDMTLHDGDVLVVLGNAEDVIKVTG